MLRFALRRLASGLVVVLLISYIAFLTQEFAVRTQTNRTSPPGQVALQAWNDTVQLWQSLPRGEMGRYISRHPFYGSETTPVSERIGGWLVNSLALLLLAMLLGGLVGGAIGLLAAATRRPQASLALILLSIIGVSTPSFFLGMLLQYLEITLYKYTGIRLVPVGGYGWDSHLVLPVLVLAARPIAQITRLTYVRASVILNEDYVRTARAKGLRRERVWWIHIIPNIAAAVLTAMGTSLRFSLSSLPVVEFLFGWPGAGMALLDMLRTFQINAAAALIVLMGALFVVLNTLLDLAYHTLDPRLREGETPLRADITWWQWLGSLLEGWKHTLLRVLFPRRTRHDVPPLASLTALVSRSDAIATTEAEDAAKYRYTRRRAWIKAVSTNPALIVGLLVGTVLLVLVVVGPSLAPHDPYVSAISLEIDGQPITPPVAPRPSYLLGTDAQGRDILSLILAGAQRTLTIAFFAVAARLLVGGALGFLAGWFAGSRLDRALLGLSEILASFPALLLAMLIVYAIGIRQGLLAFVVALALIGWGEIMQTVRSQVMAIKPMAYIEGAVAAGLGQGQILSAHVLPNIWPTMVSLAFLEMGGVLMILGELGFLGVFIGGGFGADGEGGTPSLIYYDVPEWSVMLANSWRSFRSFPWATLYPALAFFIAILGFTFLGEGIRQLTERLTLSLKTLFNRYTLMTAALLIAGISWTFQTTGLYARYASPAKTFDAERALEDVRHLTDARYNGRLSGTADADRVAEWIAQEFEKLGLQSAGEGDSYFQTFPEHYRDLAAMPTLTLRGPRGETLQGVYGQDFNLEAGSGGAGGLARGEIVIAAQKPGEHYYWLSPQVAYDFGITNEEVERTDRLFLRLTPGSLEDAVFLGHVGILTLSAHPDQTPYELLTQSSQSSGRVVPRVLISRALVERMLANSGTSVEELMRRMPKREEDEALYFPTGWTAELNVPIREREGAPARNVISFWPGSDMTLDSDAILVTAYYDGLGRSPDGTLYTGANDNASGVATLLELVRALKAQGFRPKRTLIFVAWVGGERHRAVDYSYFLKARLGFEEAYTLVAGLELEGVGAGSGSSAVLRYATRERLNEVLQKAARTVRTPLTTREQGLHANSALWPAPSRKIPSATITWSGSDALAHTPGDVAEALDPQKLAQVGRLTTLAVMVLANDPAY